MGLLRFLNKPTCRLSPTEVYKCLLFQNRPVVEAVRDGDGGRPLPSHGEARDANAGCMNVASLTSLPPSPQNVFLGDLNDFIEPSQACVNPLFKTPVTDADKAVADKSDKSGLAKIQLDSGIFDELLGQPEAIEQLQRAIASKTEGVHHAWLFTGPAGSGRSLLAQSFAAALQCEQNSCGNCQQCSLALADAHPDILTLATERVTISIDEVRSLVQKSQMSSTVGDYRIVIIEDSDRMTERTSNVLLKALEEPQEKTIWYMPYNYMWAVLYIEPLLL